MIYQAWKDDVDKERRNEKLEASIQYNSSKTIYKRINQALEV